MGPEANANDSLDELVGGMLEAPAVSDLVKRYEGLTQSSTPHPHLTGNNDNDNDNNNGNVADDHRTIALAHEDMAWATFEPTGVVATSFVSQLNKSAVSSAGADTTWETIESTASPLDRSLANGIASTLACGVPSVPEITEFIQNVQMLPEYRVDGEYSFYSNESFASMEGDARGGHEAKTKNKDSTKVLGRRRRIKLRRNKAKRRPTLAGKSAQSPPTATNKGDPNTCTRIGFGFTLPGLPSSSSPTCIDAIHTNADAILPCVDEFISTNAMTVQKTIEGIKSAVDAVKTSDEYDQAKTALCPPEVWGILADNNNGKSRSASGSIKKKDVPKELNSKVELLRPHHASTAAGDAKGQGRNFFSLSQMKLRPSLFKSLQSRGSQRKKYRFKFERQHNNSTGCAPTTDIATKPLGLNDPGDVKINHRVRITVHRQDSDLTSSIPQDTPIMINYNELESTEVTAKGDINEAARDVIDDYLPKDRSSTNDKCINKPSVLFRFPLSKMIQRSKKQQVPAPSTSTHDEKPEMPSEQVNEELLVQVAELVDELHGDALTPSMSISRAAKILERYPGEEAKLVASLKRKVEEKSASARTKKSTADKKTLRNMALLDLTSLTDATEEMPSPDSSPVSEITNRVSASTSFGDVIEETQGREEAIENLFQTFENDEGSDRARDLDDSTLHDAINGDIEWVAVNASSPMSKAENPPDGGEVTMDEEADEQVDVGISDEGVEIYFDVGDDDALANEIRSNVHNDDFVLDISVKLELYMRLEAIYGKVESKEDAQRRLQAVLDRFDGREEIVLLALRQQMECHSVEEGREIDNDEEFSTGDNEPTSQDSIGDIANESKGEMPRLAAKLKCFVKSKSNRKKKGCSIEEQSGPSSSYGSLNRIPTSIDHSNDDLYDADMSADLDAYMQTAMYPSK